jgi:hypothetical protein
MRYLIAFARATYGFAYFAGLMLLAIIAALALCYFLFALLVFLNFLIYKVLIWMLIPVVIGLFIDLVITQARNNKLL